MILTVESMAAGRHDAREVGEGYIPSPKWKGGVLGMGI